MEKEEEKKTLICQKYKKEVILNDDIKCLEPEKPCKFRLDCPIYIIWKNED